LFADNTVNVEVVVGDNLRFAAGIWVFGGAPSANARIIGNLFNAVTPQTMPAIFIETGSGHKVTDNEFVGTFSEGVRSLNMHDSSIIDNEMEDLTPSSGNHICLGASSATIRNNQRQPYAGLAGKTLDIKVDNGATQTDVVSAAWS